MIKDLFVMIKYLFIFKQSGLYHIDDLDDQISDNRYATFLFLSQPDYLKHKSQGHFQLDSLGHTTYQGIPVKPTLSGELYVNQKV